MDRRGFLKKLGFGAAGVTTAIVLGRNAIETVAEATPARFVPHDGSYETDILDGGQGLPHLQNIRVNGESFSVTAGQTRDEELAELADLMYRATDDQIMTAWR